MAGLTWQNVYSESESTAELVRSEFWPEGVGALNPVEVAERMGASVRHDDLRPGTSGVFYNRRGHNPIIVINETNSPNRQRFTCAHEIGHLTLVPEPEPEEHGVVDNDAQINWRMPPQDAKKRDGLSSRGVNLEEVYCNNFAACLLMPRKMLNAKMKLLKGRRIAVSILAREFGVSWDAMAFRLENLARTASTTS